MNKLEAIYTPALSTAIRYAVLIAPILLSIYGVLVQFDYVQVEYAIGKFGLLALSFLWLCIGIIQFLFPYSSKTDLFLRLFAFHLLTGAYLLFISGVASPFAAVWLLLMLASYIYFSNIGIQLSTLSFILVAAADVVIWYNTDSMIVVYDLITLSSILFIGIIIMAILRSKEVSREIMNNIEDQESLQKDKVLTIINNMSDAVLSTNNDGVITIYNASSLDLLDTNDSLDNKHLDNSMHLVDADEKEFNLFKYLQEQKTVTIRDDLRLKYSNGEMIRVEIRSSPIRSSFVHEKPKSNHDGFIIIMRDITKAKSLEEERDEFISVISHELRTPITIAEGTISNAQVMLEHPHVTPKMIKDSINMAHDQVVFLANMVNDLSSLSRAERGVSDTPEEIDIKELANKMHDKYAKSAKDKKIVFNLDLFPRLGSVNTSRLYLEEILQNFITNSIKYTKKGSVTLDIKRSGDDIIFTVKDTGIGISKSDLTKIFRKFYRSEDYRTRETSGTGLGLYVAAKLARKIGSTIQVSSRLNHGSSFSFSLPRVKDEK